MGTVPQVPEYVALVGGVDLVGCVLFYPIGERAGFGGKFAVDYAVMRIQLKAIVAQVAKALD